MLVLALDTTTRGGSVAVTRDDTVVALVEGDATRTHGERLPQEIEQALAMAGLRADALQLLVVASGPGAFTGLRIGLAAMQGLAMVLQTPVVGVSALEALADTAWTELGVDEASAVAPWMDAARGEVFGALYRRSTGRSERSGRQTSLPDLAELPVELAPPTVGPPTRLLAQISAAAGEQVAFVGDGAVKHAACIRESHQENRRVIDRLPPLAPALSRLGRRLAAQGAAGSPHALQPLYVRRPDAELERERHPGTCERRP